MGHHLHIALFICLLILSATLSLASDAVAAPLQSCAVGVKTCKPLASKSEKYNRCMQIICQRDKDIIADMTSGIYKCSNGYLRCNALRNNPMQYWTCVHDTCKNPSLFKAYPTCALGKENKQCKSQITNYWMCMSDTCHSYFGDFKSCLKGSAKCKPVLYGYWDCVHEICLGSIDKYSNPAYYTDQVKKGPVHQFLTMNEKRDLPVGYFIPPIKSLPREFRFAPKGIAPNDWSSNTITSARKVIGSPITDYACANPRITISCSSSDVSSCICGDGRSPIKKRDKNAEHNKKVIEYRDKYSKYVNENSPY